MPYNSVTEHPGPLKLLMVGTLIFALVSKSVYRISKFALIKKLGKKFKFFGSAILDSAIFDSAILDSAILVSPWLPFRPRLPW